MKHLYIVLLSLLCLATGASAKDFTYDFSSSIPQGWITSAQPYGFEVTGSARGAQFTESAVLTLSGVKNVTCVKITCSTNVAGKNILSVSANGTTWGTETLTKETNVVKTLTGSATNGNVVISITRAEKSVYIKQVVVTADEISGQSAGGDEPTGDDQKELDPNYKYSEPTTVSPSGVLGSNTSYEFVQNNIKVSATTGGQTLSYFGCNAGNSITFTATQPIVALSIDGYVKKDFTAEASAGKIYYVDASDDAVEDDPVLVVTDINSKSVTISCDKQMRCYEVSFYFDEASLDDIVLPDEGGEEGEYTYEYEPTTATTLNITFDEASATDYSSLLGYNYTDIVLSCDEYEMELAVFAPSAKGTGIAPGTYQITSTYEDGTIQASPGGDDFYDYPSYIATGFEYDTEYESWYYTESYYLVSGELVVEKDATGVKMTLNAKTYYGSTINATYIGSVEVENYGESGGDDDNDDDDPEEDAITSVKDARTNGTFKYMKDGKLMMQRGGHVYNATGLMVK